MSKKRLRVLIARFGEGYEQAMVKLAYSCCEAGFEVVYSDLNDPEAIVACAVQESVDHIGITTLPGARVEDFSRLFQAMEKGGITHVRVTAGGLFPEEDVTEIRRLGVVDFYPRGSIYKKIEEWTQEYGGPAESAECRKFETG